MNARQKKYTKWAILTVILLTIVAVAYYFLKPKPQQPNYITATVERGDIEKNVMDIRQN